MIKLLVGLVVFVGLTSWSIVFAQQIEIQPGQVAHCITKFTLDQTQQFASCITQTPTSTATATATATTTPSGHPNNCHVPTTHDHGHCPPPWVVNSNMAPTFDGNEAHVGFKGVLIPNAQGTEIYALVHLISTPSGRLTQHHSHKLWIKDSSGGISTYQGSLDTGDPATRRIPRNQPDPGFRPIALVVDQATLNQYGYMCEVWYTRALQDINWDICPPVYLHDPTDTTDPSTWTLSGGGVGLQRGIDINWYSSRQPVGAFTHQGLPQYTAPTLINDALDDGFGSIKIFARMAYSISCPQCIAPN